jgi:hypothetical protein
MSLPNGFYQVIAYRANLELVKSMQRSSTQGNLLDVGHTFTAPYILKNSGKAHFWGLILTLMVDYFLLAFK